MNDNDNVFRGLPATRDTLARAIISVAASGGMPDSFWVTDSRIDLARKALIDIFGFDQAVYIERRTREEAPRRVE